MAADALDHLRRIAAEALSLSGHAHAGDGVDETARPGTNARHSFLGARRCDQQDRVDAGRIGFELPGIELLDREVGQDGATGLSNDLTNFNGGSYTASTGTWTGTAAQFDALTFKAGEDGVQHLTITAATTGAEAGSTTENYTLTVNPVAEGPVLGGAISATRSRAGGDARRHGYGGR